MTHTDKHRQEQGEQSALEERSKRADAGAAPEQDDQTPDKNDTKDDGSDNDNNDDELVDPREKRQDPPVEGQPSKIRVEQ